MYDAMYDVRYILNPIVYNGKREKGEVDVGKDHLL